MRRRSLATRLVAFAGLTVGCNGGLEPTPVCPTTLVGICGTVTFQGQLPDSLKDSTQAVFIIAYKNFPTAPESLFHFAPFPPPVVPTNNASYVYTLSLPAGRYEWVLAVWEKKSAAPLSAQNADTLLREVGFYTGGSDITSHGSGAVTVTGTHVDGIAFVIDFSNMHRICTYFPPCPP